MTKNDREIDNWVSKWVGQQPNADDKDVQKLLYRRAYDILGQAVAYRADASEGRSKRSSAVFRNCCRYACGERSPANVSAVLASAIPMRRSVRPRGASRCIPRFAS